MSYIERNRTQFVELFNRISNLVYVNNIQHGFHDMKDNKFYIPTKLGLIMSEGAEALEAHRKGDNEHIVEELADVVLRCMDLAEAEGWDLGSTIVDKHLKNLDRPFKHGNKLY